MFIGGLKLASCKCSNIARITRTSEFRSGSQDNGGRLLNEASLARRSSNSELQTNNTSRRVVISRIKRRQA